MWFCIVFKDFTNCSNLKENEQIQFDLHESDLIAAYKRLALDAINRKIASKRKTDLTYALYRIKGTLEAYLRHPAVIFPMKQN